MTVIKDGSGKGYTAQVDVDNRLRTQAVTESSFHEQSEAGNGYCISSQLLTPTLVGGRMLWVRPTLSEKPLHIIGISIGYNGGSTNFNRTAVLELYLGDAQPSANNVVGSPINPNVAFSATPAVEFQYWDGVGNGMTATPGLLIASFLVGKGLTSLGIDGGMLVDKGSSIGFNVKPEEVGSITLSMSGYISAD